MVPCALDFSGSLKFGIAVFAFDVAVTSSSLYKLLHCIPIHIFLLQWCARTSPQETWTSTKVSLIHAVTVCQCFPGPTRPWLKRFGASSWATAGTKIHLHIIWYTSGRNSTQTPWCLVPDPNAPSKALLYMGGCQIVVVKGWGMMRICWCHMMEDIFMQNPGPH